MSPYFKLFAPAAAVVLLLLLLCASMTAQATDKDWRPPPTTAPAPAEPPRTFWLTPDNNGGRDAHLGASAVIGMALKFNDPAAPWWNRTAWCMVPGTAKELLDYASGSGASRQDLKHNLLGCLGGIALGSGLLYLTRGARGAPALALSIPLQ